MRIEPEHLLFGARCPNHISTGKGGSVVPVAPWLEHFQRYCHVVAVGNFHLSFRSLIKVLQISFAIMQTKGGFTEVTATTSPTFSFGDRCWYVGRGRCYVNFHSCSCNVGDKLCVPRCFRISFILINVVKRAVLRTIRDIFSGPFCPRAGH